MSVCDPHRKAYVNRIGTVGDTQQIANDLQRYYVCVGSPEPFVISRYRTRELGVNRAQCKIQSQSYFFRKRVGSQTKSTRHSCRNRRWYTTNHKRSASLVCVRRGSWTVCDRTLSQTVIVGKRVRWSLAWQTGYAENSCAMGHKSHTVHMLARVPYILFPKRFITTDRMVSLRH